MAWCAGASKTSHNCPHFAETTVGRELKALGFVKISAGVAQNELAIEDFKKTFPRLEAPSRPMTEIELWWQDDSAARKTRSPGAGRHEEPVAYIFGAIRRAASGRPSSCPAATPGHAGIG